MCCMKIQWTCLEFSSNALWHIWEVFLAICNNDLFFLCLAVGSHYCVHSVAWWLLLFAGKHFCLNFVSPTADQIFFHVHFHLSHMAYRHHLPYHLHDHHSHLLLLVLSFILNLRLGSLPNHFLHKPSPFLSDWFHGLTDHLTFYSPQRLDLFAWCFRLSRLLVGFRTHFKSSHFLLLLLLLPRRDDGQAEFAWVVC